MRRVYFIWGVKQVFNLFTLKLFLIAGLLWQLKEAIFVRQVFANMANFEAFELLRFLSAAFWNTELMVQLAILGIGIAGILIFRDIVTSRESTMVLAR